MGSSDNGVIEVLNKSLPPPPSTAYQKIPPSNPGERGGASPPPSNFYTTGRSEVGFWEPRNMGRPPLVEPRGGIPAVRFGAIA